MTIIPHFPEWAVGLGSAVGGISAIKLLEFVLPTRKQRMDAKLVETKQQMDDAAEFRRELRSEMETMRGQMRSMEQTYSQRMNSLQAQVDVWRERSYELKEKLGLMLVRHERLQLRLNDELRAQGKEPVTHEPMPVLPEWEKEGE